MRSPALAAVTLVPLLALAACGEPENGYASNESSAAFGTSSESNESSAAFGTSSESTTHDLHSGARSTSRGTTASTSSGPSEIESADMSSRASAGGTGSGSGTQSEPSASGEGLRPPLNAARVFHVGHSLVNHDMPRMLEQAALDAGRTHEYAVQIINGANLQWQWNNSTTAEGEDARAVLPGGDYDVLVITEAVPLDNHLTWSDTEDYAGRFYALAVEANPAARVFLYESWHCIHSGTEDGCEWDDGDDVAWRDRLTADAAKWQGIADHVNANHEGPPMRVIPVGQAMAVLHDQIAAGGVYSLDRIDQIFSDDIHLTAVGNYFVAMVHYAAIYRRSPVGLAFQTTDRWGTPFEAPHEPLAWTLQEIAWEVVSSDPAYGVLEAE